LWDDLPDTSLRILELHKLLKSEGYVIVQADGCQNPAMIATRLPVSSIELLSFCKGATLMTLL
jgi:hypothetical protein